MKRKFIFMAFAILFLAGAVGVSSNARAQSTASASSSGLVISPPVTEKTLTPGSTYSDAIKVTNPNPVDLKIELKVELSVSDFKAKGEEGGQEFIDPEVSASSFALAKWIKTDGEFNLGASETKEINYTINVPEDAEPGGHYGVIFFTPTPSNSSQLSGSGAFIVPKVGSLLLVTVPGEITYNGRIAGFTADKKISLDSTARFNLISRFENLSSIHVKPTGKIRIKNALGKEVASLEVNEKAGNVLPESIRRFENEWVKKRGFGYYKATLDLNYVEGKNTTANLVLWLVPWKETAGALVLIIILTWIIRHMQWKRPAGPGSSGSKSNTTSPDSSINQT